MALINEARRRKHGLSDASRYRFDTGKHSASQTPFNSIRTFIRSCGLELRGLDKHMAWRWERYRHLGWVGFNVIDRDGTQSDRWIRKRYGQSWEITKEMPRELRLVFLKAQHRALKKATPP